MQATVCAKFGLTCIVYMGAKVLIACTDIITMPCLSQASSLQYNACAVSNNACLCNVAVFACWEVVVFCPIDLPLTLQDMERQQLNVFRMRLLGAEVRSAPVQ